MYFSNLLGRKTTIGSRSHRRQKPNFRHVVSSENVDVGLVGAVGAVKPKGIVAFDKYGRHDGKQYVSVWNGKAEGGYLAKLYDTV